MRSTFKATLAISASLTVATAVWGHSVDEQANIETPQVTIVSRPEGQILPAVVEGVIDQFKLWQAGSTIRGCFYQSSPAVRRGLVEVSQEWLKNANLQIDFGDDRHYRTCDTRSGGQIRISFEPTGNWSYVGTDSIRVDLAKPSMNIHSGNSMGSAIVDNVAFKSTVLHEMGHALGLQHEHQSPKSNCDDEFDWKAVYSQFKLRYGWNYEKVDHNLRTLIKSDRLRTTEYDPRSIMHYYFPPWMFTRGESSSCYVPHNGTLSELDIATVKLAYPANAGAQLELVNQRLQTVKALVDKSVFDTETKDTIEKKVREVVADNFPRADLGDFSGGTLIQTRGDGAAVINGSSIGGNVNIDVQKK